MTRAAVIALVVLSACDGVGRAIVGPRPIDGGGDSAVEELPCDPPRTVSPEHFELDEARLTPALDCDGDGVDDTVDVCRGVPDVAQDPSICAEATRQCARLASGVADLAGLDLRGCTADVVLGDHLDLQDTQLRCARLSFTSDGASRVDLSGARAEGALFDARGAGATTLTLTDAQLVDTIVRVEGGAHAEADRGSFSGGAFVIGPGAPADTVVPPALRLSGVRLAGTVVVELGGGRAGRVRFDEIEAEGTFIRAPVVDLVGGSFAGGNLDIGELTTVGTSFSGSAIRAADGVISEGTMNGVIVDRCDQLLLSGVYMSDVDVPGCTTGPAILRAGHAIDSRLGGVDVTSTRLIESVVGPAPTFTLRNGALESVRLCQLGHVELRSSRLEIVYCTPEDIGTACVESLASWSVACAPVEEAPSCGFE